ncbi:BRI3-binding protein [Lemmus lemmus]
MGARASQEPQARVGLGLLLLLLLLALMLLALVAPGAQGARGRGAADSSSHRRVASTFSQSVSSSLFGEDNVPRLRSYCPG